MISRDELAHLLKDALTDLYNPARLEMNPLTGFLVPRPSSLRTKGENLRIVLRESISLLKPPASVPAERPEWLSYEVLWLHFVRLRSEQETCSELNISEATYYRRLHEALEALVSILWERFGEQQVENSPLEAESGSLPFEEARARAVSLLGASSQQRIDLVPLIEGVHETILPFAVERGVTLRVDVPLSIPSVYGEPSVFRQIFVGIVAEGIRLSPDKTLELGARVDEQEIVWQLRGLGTDVQAFALDDPRSFVLNRDLLNLVHGRLWVEEDERHLRSVCFTMPIARPQCILIIEDDPATADLYRRYLQVSDYVVLESHTAEEAAALLAHTRPDLILLDVMMPRVDGWTVLQTLRATQEGSRIPVIICSVIDQPSLALTLGASEVLMKPISRETLLEAIGRQLAREDTTD